MPPDVRKVSDLPDCALDLRSYAPAGEPRRIFGGLTVGHSHHRTSDGEAGKRYRRLRMVEEIRVRKDITVQLMINQNFHHAFMELKQYAAATSEELKSPVLRLLQIEGRLEKYINRTSLKSVGPLVRAGNTGAFRNQEL